MTDSTGSEPIALDVLPPSDGLSAAASSGSVLLIGNPNAGKTSLFNQLTGLRAKTANFAGTTVDFRLSRMPGQGDQVVQLIDLPGLYSLDALSPEEVVAERALRGQIERIGKPSLVVLAIDSTCLERNLFLASQVLELGIPTVVALTMSDVAQRVGIAADCDKLAQELGCPVVSVSSRTGDGIQELRQVVLDAVAPTPSALPIAPQYSGCGPTCRSCPFAERYDWAEGVATRCESGQLESHGKKTEAIDAVLTHPVGGVVAFLSVMLAVFYTIFVLADVPMGLIEGVFGSLGEIVSGVLPAGLLQSLIVDGIIGGVGGVLVFLPQICILFFFITLLEDSGYMARAAFVMEKLMRRVGLPGKAFVPMLSAHACAIPGIMATRVIEDRRDRLATILVLPLVTCSARLPVYAMIAMLLYRDQPQMAAVLFLAAYVLGIVAALGMAFLFKRSLLKGQTRPMVIELPSYRLPGLRNALLTTLDRAKIFLRKAGTVILVISIILWAMMTWPMLDESDLPADAAAQVAQLRLEADRLDAEADGAAGATDAATDEQPGEALRREADLLFAQHALEYSLAGRIGKAVEPILSPLGFDWRINVGVVSSFAARETVVSTLAIVYGMEEEAAEDEATLSETLRRQTHPDGTPVFTTATCFSLLVFYVLAMQCLPTQAVTRRETGHWGWAAFQLGYMTLLAWAAAFVTFQSFSLWTS